RTVFASAGLCLGFGAILSDLTIAEELQEGVDHVDGRVVLESVPIRIDPMSTAVTVTGEAEQLRTMAFAWISDPCCSWRLSAELAQLPELAGTGLAPTSPPPPRPDTDRRPESPSTSDSMRQRTRRFSLSAARTPRVRSR